MNNNSIRKLHMKNYHKQYDFLHICDNNLTSPNSEIIHSQEGEIKELCNQLLDFSMDSNCINSNNISLNSLDNFIECSNMKLIETPKTTISDNFIECSNMQLIETKNLSCSNMFVTIDNKIVTSDDNDSNIKISKLKCYSPYASSCSSSSCSSSLSSSPSSHHSSHFFRMTTNSNIQLSNLKCSRGDSSSSFSGCLFESQNYITSSNIGESNISDIPIKYISIINCVPPYIPPHRKNPNHSSLKHQYENKSLDDHNCLHHPPHPNPYPHPWPIPHRLPHNWPYPHPRPNHYPCHIPSNPNPNNNWPYPFNHYNNNMRKPTPLEMLFYRSMKRKTKKTKK